MTSLSAAPARFIGCDVSKANIAVYDSLSGQNTTVLNTANDLADFVAGLDRTCFVICEATGGYEAALLRALTEACIPAHRADARKVKAFIRSYGTLGKSDDLDARGLSRYGQERHSQLTLWKGADKQQDQLQALVLTRRDLVADRTAWGNRRTAPGAEAVEPLIKPLMDCLEAQIGAIDMAIEAAIKASQTFDRAAKTLKAVPGIGPQTAASLIALMPELGSLNRRQAAALAGLAPHPNQTGNSNGYRRTKGGRPEIKRVLFMAALSAARHNPILKVFHDKLIAKGKKPLVALIALMRKLIVICNAKLRPEQAVI